jgi:hypothetical protein
LALSAGGDIIPKGRNVSDLKEKMKFDASTEWRNFEAALIKELKETPIAEFARAWTGLFDRTAFYRNVLLPRVAKSLGYVLAYEHLRCDFVILNTDRVPVIFIESENNHLSASQEIDKLCAVSSPVRVLFLSCEWAEGQRERWLPGWQKTFATHHIYSEQKAVYMIVVGEWMPRNPGDDMKELYYIIESFDISGKEIDRKELVLDRSPL